MMSDDLRAEDVLAAYGISVEEEAGDEYRGVVVLAECAAGAVSEAAVGALGIGREIADTFGARLEALILGGGEQEAAAAIRLGADAAVIADVPPKYEQASWATAMASAVEQRKAEVVVLGGSDIACDIGPRVAQRLDTGLIAGVRQARAEADERLVVAIVPLYGGRLLGEFAIPAKRPQMICLAEGAGRMPTEDGSREGEIERLST